MSVLEQSERLQRRGREATSPGFITAHCIGGEIALELSMPKQVRKWTVDDRSE